MVQRLRHHEARGVGQAVVRKRDEDGAVGPVGRPAHLHAVRARARDGVPGKDGVLLHLSGVTGTPAGAVRSQVDRLTERGSRSRRDRAGDDRNDRRCASEREHVRALLGFDVAGRGEGENFLLGVGNQAIRVHRNGIVRAQESERTRFFGRRCDLRHCDGLKRALNERKRIGIVRTLRNRVERTHQHLFRPATCGDQSNSNFDETNISLSRRAHAIRVQSHLATAAERHLKRRDHDRLRRITQTHRRVLKRADD